MSTAHPRADAVVVAAGASRRMGGRDKLMLPLRGRPLLAWAVEAIAAAQSVERVVVVTASDRVDELRTHAWLRAVSATVVEGGHRRQESVAAGLAETRADVVLVHDGARPLVTPELVDRVALAAAEHGAAIPIVPVAETLKRLDGDRVASTVSRDGLAAAQTPQGVRRDLLLRAFGAHPPSGEETFTDEASLLEAEGIAVAAIAGAVDNIKVTDPGDLERADAFLQARLGPPRTALGTDAHPFGPERGLALGGITIDDAPRLHGHSDGDVVLHAVADALLGASGLRDLGRVFPATDGTTRGIASMTLLQRVVADVISAGWRARAIDVTITGQRPHLGGETLDRMREAIAHGVGVPVESVSVKASTGNLLGPEGAGRAISATAIATVER